MNDHPPAQPFSSHLHLLQQQLPPCHLASPALQAPGLGYPSSQPGPEPPEPPEDRESQEEDSATSFLMSSPSPGGRRERSWGDRHLLATGNLNGDANLGGEPRASGQFPHTFEYCASKREDLWEDGESFDSAAESFYPKENGCRRENEVFHVMTANMEEIRRDFNADHTEASASQHATPFTRSASDGPEFCRTSSTVSDHYAGRDEDFGSSCGSGEDHLQPAEVEGPWFGTSPSRGAAGALSGDLAQHSPVSIGGGTYPQKLDSFSDAFLTQRRGRFPIIPRDDPGGQIWEFGKVGSPRLDGSRQSCALEQDHYLPPASASSPFHSSFASFPSPSTSSPLVSAVLSPPPTPRPPPSFSPAAFGGSGQSTSHGLDPLGTLQFFAPYSPSLPSVQPSPMIWKLPLVAHSFSPPSALKGDCERDFGNFSVTKGNLRSHSDVTAPPKRASPEWFQASGLPPSVLRPSSLACLPPSCHLPSLPSLQTEVADGAERLLVTQKTPADVLNPAQHQPSQIYTGTPFPSILRSGRGQRKGLYTPRPLLNPARRGTGLSFNLSPQHQAADGGGDGAVLPYVNIGPEFQAELPPYALTRDGTARWRTDEESPREQLLWKPWKNLEDIVSFQDQVEKLLSVCSSSCLPGGGSNTELALHCLHYCQGDLMATLEMLLFSQPSPAGDYHYPGSDCWTEAEKSLFNAALGAYGKEFSLIRKTVRTKTVQQCVEFFYLSKKLRDKQDKQKQENQDGGLEQNTSATPSFKPMSTAPVPEELLPLPSLAGFFPCKLCGKMFYKIKSRNAHMKIHRQPPDDWADRRLQQQLLGQRSGASLHPSQVPFRSVPSPCLPGRTRNADMVLNLLTQGTAPSSAGVLDPGAMATCSNNVASSSHVSADATQRERASRGPFFQSWGPFGPESAAFYCSAEGKDEVGAAALGGKEPIRWQ